MYNKAYLRFLVFFLEKNIVAYPYLCTKATYGLPAAADDWLVSESDEEGPHRHARQVPANDQRSGGARASKRQPAVHRRSIIDHYTHNVSREQ